MDYKTVLKYSSEARAVYGTGPKTAALNTAQYGVVPVERFQATSPDFQAALYKDPVSGRYRIAVAGTNDLGGDLVADGALAAQSLLVKASAFASAWHPEMTDALKFSFEAVKQIAKELKEANPDRSITLDDVRAAVDVTGHSLGGALSELIHKFFGLDGANIDGPGTSALTQFPEFAAMQAAVRKTFPELQSDYVTPPGSFVANAMSVVGMAGTHLDDTAFDATPNAYLTFPMSLAAVVTMPLSGPAELTGGLVAAGAAGLIGGLATAWADAAPHHPLGLIVQYAEHQQGLTPATQLPAVDFGALIHDPHAQLYLSDMAGATEYGRALTWLAERRQENISAGLPPNGAPMNGDFAADGHDERTHGWGLNRLVAGSRRPDQPSAAAAADTAWTAAA